MLKISNAKIVDDGITEGNVYVENGKITAVTKENLPFDEELDICGNYLSAGFVDMHVHGGGGFDVMDGDVQSVREVAKMHLSHGTTSIFPTTVAAGREITKKVVENIKSAMDFPTIRGTHLEGPYFSLAQCGAQSADCIRDIDFNEAEELLKSGIIKRWDFAPEKENSSKFCELLNKYDVVSAIGHSDAIYDDVLKVYNMGCRLVTHLYSATSTITRVDGYRRLGINECAYLFDDMLAEIIADGSHLPLQLLKLIIKLKGVDKISLITDAMRAAGMPDGEYILGNKDTGIKCVKEAGVAKLPDRSAFAGSVATTDMLVRTMYKKVGLDLSDAVKMMTRNPAEIMGLKTKGRIKPQYDADIVVFDDDINIKHIFVGGSKY